MRSVPDWTILLLGRDADPALEAEDRGEDGRPLALAAVRRRIAMCEGGDRPPSPSVRLLRAEEELSR